ncbi:hypothetical protein H0H87_010952, partial [Tephrocybe sp. NHM501043]
DLQPTLPSLPALCSLWLHGVDITLPSSQNWVAHLLAHLDAPNLHKLTLDVYVDPILALPMLPPLNTINTPTILNPHIQLKNLNRIEVRWLPGNTAAAPNVSEEMMHRVRAFVVLAEEREIEIEEWKGPLPRASTLEPHRVYERWFDRDQRDD